MNIEQVDQKSNEQAQASQHANLKRDENNIYSMIRRIGDRKEQGRRVTKIKKIMTMPMSNSFLKGRTKS